MQGLRSGADTQERSTTAVRIRPIIWRIALALAALAPAAPIAQGGSGAIAGLVTDSSGAALPCAFVKIVNDRTNVATNTVTNQQGSYRIEALIPGAYRIEVALDGFQTAVRRIVLDAGQTSAVDVVLTLSGITEAVVVTARRVEEAAQEVPIPVSVVSGGHIAEAGAFNVNRVKELIPTVQFYSSNPRNSAINIRGLGAPFGLTNDGIEPGVGLYIDGVFHARPASATLDFLDVERIEVLRGPQGTLFGKNTTAGAINITTRKPSFTPEADFELTYGSLGFIQAKGSIAGPLSQTSAARLSFSGTQRDGTIYNVKTQDDVNDLNNLGVRGQLVFTPTDAIVIAAATDYTRQRPEGYTQVVAGVVPTRRSPNRQYARIAADLEYAPPSFNAFDRLTDIDTPMRSYQDLSGASVTVDWKLGGGLLTSTTAWRLWNWDPSNDRDFIGLPVTPISAAPSRQRQWTQEVRYAGDVSRRVNLVLGAFAFRQRLDSDPAFKQEQGPAAARFFLMPSAAAATPGLLDGYGQDQYVRFGNVSTAVFGQVAWSVTDRLRLLPGLRFNYDQKDVNFDQQVYGGLTTTSAALIALQRSVLAPQTYEADINDTNVSGQLTLAYKALNDINAYATYATGFKSVGLNLNGVPTDASGQPVLSTAIVKPEDVRHLELGLKTAPFRGVTANVTTFDTEVKDFQANVVNAQVGVLRGYLANARRVRVRGVEFDATARVNDRLSFYGAGAYTDGRYVSFPDAPPPLEETGGAQVKDISGSLLPGLSKWSMAFGVEYANPGTFLGQTGQFFGALHSSYRSSFSSNPSASRYLVVDGYALLNARIGFRRSDGWTLSLWSRNLLNKNYFEFLSVATGNSGLYVGLPGDPRTFGVTMRRTFRSSAR